MRRLLFILAIFILLVSLTLLLNITHPNPTHRRYSSEAPLITGQANNAAIGLSAEQVLATDLGVTRNDDVTQRQCICSNSTSTTPSRQECNICFGNAPISGSHRRPDFITTRYIAESKNRLNLLYGMNDTLDEQLLDYAIAAREWGLPLWIFVRVNTVLSPEIAELARATGGDVVAYFIVPGYVDPVDRAAQIGAVASGFMIVVIVLSRRIHIQIDRKPKSPKPNTIDTAEQFVQNTRDRYQAKSDKEDTRRNL
mgnify:CR=1 FL=1